MDSGGKVTVVFGVSGLASKVRGSPLSPALLILATRPELNIAPSYDANMTLPQTNAEKGGPRGQRINRDCCVGKQRKQEVGILPRSNMAKGG